MQLPFKQHHSHTFITNCWSNSTLLHTYTQATSKNTDTAVKEARSQQILFCETIQNSKLRFIFVKIKILCSWIDQKLLYINQLKKVKLDSSFKKNAEQQPSQLEEVQKWRLFPKKSLGKLMLLWKHGGWINKKSASVDIINHKFLLWQQNTVIVRSNACKQRHHQKNASSSVIHDKSNKDKYTFT